MVDFDLTDQDPRKEFSVEVLSTARASANKLVII